MPARNSSQRRMTRHEHNLLCLSSAVTTRAQVKESMLSLFGRPTLTIAVSEHHLSLMLSCTAPPVVHCADDASCSLPSPFPHLCWHSNTSWNTSQMCLLCLNTLSEMVERRKIANSKIATIALRFRFLFSPTCDLKVCSKVVVRQQIASRRMRLPSWWLSVREMFGLFELSNRDELR